jgi:uncharacterized protein YbaR (Trm112 family)
VNEALQGLRCPMCYQPLDTNSSATTAGIRCDGCGHLWQIVDGQVVATTAARVVSADTAARIVPSERGKVVTDGAIIPPARARRPAAQTGTGPLTARRAHPFIKKEIG